MAKKVTGYIKLQIPAGQATPAPPVGPALGQHGVNIGQFVKQFNDKTAGPDTKGLMLPVIITVYSDRSFEFKIKSPPAAVLIKLAAKIPAGKKQGKEVIAPPADEAPTVVINLMEALQQSVAAAKKAATGAADRPPRLVAPGSAAKAKEQRKRKTS